MARIADGGFATSASMGAIATFSNFEPVVTLIAGVVGIATGIFAGLYYYEQWREMRRRRKP